MIQETPVTTPSKLNMHVSLFFVCMCHKGQSRLGARGSRPALVTDPEQLPFAILYPPTAATRTNNIVRAIN